MLVEKGKNDILTKEYIKRLPRVRPGHNTTNAAYKAADIHSIGVWHELNVNTILERYRNILIETHLPSPPRAITSENVLNQRVVLLPEYGFAHDAEPWV